MNVAQAPVYQEITRQYGDPYQGYMATTKKGALRAHKGCARVMPCQKGENERWTKKGICCNKPRTRTARAAWYRSHIPKFISNQIKAPYFAGYGSVPRAAGGKKKRATQIWQDTSQTPNAYFVIVKGISSRTGKKKYVPMGLSQGDAIMALNEYKNRASGHKQPPPPMMGDNWVDKRKVGWDAAGHVVYHDRNNRPYTVGAGRRLKPGGVLARALPATTTTFGGTGYGHAPWGYRNAAYWTEQKPPVRKGPRRGVKRGEAELIRGMYSPGAIPALQPQYGAIPKMHRPEVVQPMQMQTVAPGGEWETYQGLM